MKMDAARKREKEKESEREREDVRSPSSDAEGELG